MFSIWETVSDSQTITTEQNVWFQGRLFPEKFQLDEIQNGRLAVSIDSNMRNIWKTVPDSYIIIMEKDLRFEGGGGWYTLKNVSSIKFEMADLWLLLTLIYLICGKPCNI